MASKTAKIVLECEIRVDARMERVDYGVPGSPVWHEPRDMVLDRVIEIEGVSVKVSSFPVELQKIIKDMAESDVDDSEGWEK